MDLQIRPMLADLVGSTPARIVFELHGVTFMDAGGLGFIDDTRRTALAAGGCVRLVAPSSSVRRLLTLTGCDHVFQTFASTDQAVSAPLDTGNDPTGGIARSS